MKKIEKTTKQIELTAVKNYLKRMHPGREKLFELWWKESGKDQYLNILSKKETNY